MNLASWAGLGALVWLIPIVVAVVYATVAAVINAAKRGK